MTRLLIVEDSATQAEALRFRLERAGYEVSVVHDGQRALAACAAQPFDMVLSDVNMPYMSGFELCTKIKADPMLRGMPVILLTSRSDPLAILRGLECGADNFITKPYDESFLLDRVQSILDNRRRDRRLSVGVEVMFLGRKFVITSEKEQILDLLVSTFEEVVQSNRELESRTFELHLILENIGDGVVVVDADGQLVLSNPMAQQLLGPGALMKRTLSAGPQHGFFRLDRRTPLAPEEMPLARALAGESIDELEVFVRTPHSPHGTYISISARPLRNDHGRVRGGVIAFRDVSERKRVEALIEAQAQEQSRAKERAEQESRYKSRFLASMSHELRTPLNAIIGFSELLDQELFGTLNTRQKEYVGYVVQSGRHLLSLVNDILDLSKIEAGRMELTREWVAALELIDAVQGSVQPLAQKQGVSFTVEAPPSLPELYVDEMRLRQILYNLLSNAIKFTKAGGAVTLRVRLEREQLELEVHDTGIGIRPEDLPRLFREFERTNMSAKTEGTGLGLALTKRLVELHGGSIRVESEPGIGSTFTVVLPAFGAHVGGEAEDPAASPASDAPVLVIDPETDAVASTLRAAGVSVVSARDGDAALALTETLTPSAIVLVLHLPGTAGWALLTRLKRTPSALSIPTLVCVMDPSKQRFVVLGATEFLPKPVAADVLLRTLEAIGIPLHRIAGLRVLLVGEHAARLEEMLRAAHSEVRTLASLAERSGLDGFVPEVALVDLGAASSEQVAMLAARETLPFPVIALIDGSEQAPPWLSAPLAALPAEAYQPERLLRSVHDALRRRGGPGWYAGTGLPGPSGLLAHLRTGVLQASLATVKLAVAVAEVAPPTAPVAAPWMQLLFQRLRPSEFLAAASEQRLALVVQAEGSEEPADVAERLASLLQLILGLEVRAVRTLRYPEAGRTAEDLFSACGQE